MSIWDKRIEKAETYLQPCHEHGRRVYERYEDNRQEASSLSQKANFFYANVNTLKESLFNSLPKPEVSRIQRGDFEDDASRVAATVVQRGLTYEVECAVAFDEAVTNAILDRLVPGLGQVWITFDMDKDEEDQPIEGTESIKVEHVFWEDFIYEPQRSWSKVGWVARRVHLTKKEMIRDFGEDVLDRIGSGGNDADDNMTPKEINRDKFCIYELWDKRKKQVHHIYKGMEEPLKTEDDPYDLVGFFPCPKPLIANPNTIAFKPRTDYSIAQDQYNQLDLLYGRIQLIVEAIKVAGLYDSSNTAISRMLQGNENKLIPVDNWAMHAERGGTRGQIDWFPVEQVSMVLQSLYAAFEATKQILFEITGMSDIIRGASSPYETKGAQQIKAEFASVRMGGYQRDVSKFVRDILRIMGEMFVQLYSDKKILTIIGTLPPDDMQVLPQAAQILRDDLMMKYKITIQTNSLTQADWGLEKEQRMELVNTIGQMIGQTTELAKETPELAMLGVQLIKFAIAGYKAGTELEGWIDKQLDEMVRAATQAKDAPPEPSPEQQAMQAEQQAEQQKMQMEMEKAKQEMAMDQQRAQMEMQLKQFELQHRQQMAQLEMQIKQMELAMKQQESELKIQSKREEAQLNAEVKQAGAAMDLESKAASHEQKLQQSKEAAKAKPTKGADK